MMKLLLWRGMFAGLIGGLIAASVALLLAEPSVDAAIALEAGRHAHDAAGAEPELVSRATQKSAGLYTAMTLYGVALGGMFAIVFAVAYGRWTRLSPRALALSLGVIGFVVVTLVPALKYPPTPPAVGLHDTVRLRTAAYFAMLAVSIVAAALSARTVRAGAALTRPDRLLAGLALYTGIVAVLASALPSIDEVPATFPASLLWHFRIAAIAAQAAFWLATADLFGRLAERLPPLGGSASR